MKNERDITLRRSIQQLKHCVEEALSVVENEEDERCAVDDLEQARQLIDHCLKQIR